MSMRVSDFDFQLPESFIALAPAAPRDSCRLLVIDRSGGTLEHRRFFDLPELLSKGDLLILNDTMVFPARLTVTKPTGGRIDLLLVRELEDGSWEVLYKGRYTGNVMVEGRRCAELSGGRVIRFALPREEVPAFIQEAGKMPLPPYIKRPPAEEDRVWYQTVYAEKEGSIAAPTAGLHFSPGLIQALKQKGVLVRFVTLHVGVGTFKPVTAALLGEHRMDAEYFEIEEPLLDEIRRVKDAGGRVIATGTTATRAIEGFFSGTYTRRNGETLRCGDSGHRETPQTAQPRICGSTDIFIYPGYVFRAVNGLITNFHLPRSTPLMLTASLCGREKLLGAYRDAMERGYRFFSYGDAMLIL